MRIAKSTYWSALTGFVLALAPLATATAQADGELERAEGELRILEASRELSSVLRDIKGHLRATDNMAEFLARGDEADETSAKYLLRRSVKLLEALSAEVAPIPPAGERLLDGRDKARRGVAAADLLITMARAMNEAEFSTGSDKLRDLKTIFGHTETILPMISILGEGLALNPVISAYFTVMKKAIENIAESAEIIEEEIDKRNAAIRMARDAIGADQGQESVLDELEERLAAMVEQRANEVRQMRAGELAPMFTDVDAAERVCRRQLGLDETDVGSLRTNVINARFRVAMSSDSLAYHQGGVIPNLGLLISSAEGDLQLAVDRVERGQASARDQVLRITREIESRRRELSVARGKVARWSDAIAAARPEYDAARRAIQSYDDCVRQTVRDQAQDADSAFLEEYFPRYDASHWDLDGIDSDPESSDDQEDEQELDANGIWQFPSAIMRLIHDRDRQTIRVVYRDTFNFQIAGAPLFEATLDGLSFRGDIPADNVLHGCHGVMEGTFAPDGNSLTYRWFLPDGCGTISEPHYSPDYYTLSRISR